LEPEAALYKRTSQIATGKLAAYGYDHEHARLPYLGSSVGRAYYNRSRLFFLISFRTTDLEEQ
jgi:hypothetical protein